MKLKFKVGDLVMCRYWYMNDTRYSIIVEADPARINHWAYKVIFGTKILPAAECDLEPL